MNAALRSVVQRTLRARATIRELMPARQRAAALWRVDASGILQAVMGASYGLAAPVTVTYLSGSGTETAPVGASQVVVEVWGGGAGGAHGSGLIANCNDATGSGAGAGGYSRTTLAIVGGQTLAYAVGAGGIGQPTGSNTLENGAASSVSSGTATITTMTANGGGGAIVATPGAGGTASGGTDANTTGTTGPGFDIGGFAAGTTGLHAGPAGAGGKGGYQSTGAGFPGGSGEVSFYYT